MRCDPRGALRFAVGALVALGLAVPRTAASATTPAAWTLVLYFNGDGPPGQPDLGAAVAHRLNSLLTGAEHPRVNVLALVDGPPSRTPTDVRVQAFGTGSVVPLRWAKTKLLHLRPDYGVELEAEQERDLGDPASLERILTLARTSYPAARYALAIKSHGAADESLCEDAVAGPGADGAPASDPLTIAELRGVLERFAKDRGRALDLLVLDACSMLTVDTLGTLGPYVDAFAGSDELLLSTSVPYARLVAAMNASASPDGRQAGAALVDAYPDELGLGGNLPTPCDRGEPFGCLAVVPSAAVAAVQASFDALGERAIALLSATAPADAAERVWQQLAVARLRSYHAFGPKDTLDARSVAAAIARCVDDPLLRWAALGAAQAAREAAAALRKGADLEGTCGLAVAWPRTTTPWQSDPLWSGRGWPRFVAAFLARREQLGSLEPVTDLRTTVTAAPSPPISGPQARARTSHEGGAEGVAPFVARRAFFAGPSSSAPDAMFRLPFASPWLTDATLPQTATFDNLWSYGRFVFLGSATTPNGPDEAECPIADTGPVAGWTADGTPRCWANSGDVEITLPGAPDHPFPATLRLVVEKVPPLVITIPVPAARWPSPWPDRDGERVLLIAPAIPWRAEVVCAYTSDPYALAPGPASTFSLALAPGGIVGGPPVGGPVGTAEFEHAAPVGMRGEPHRVPLPPGTRIRTRREVQVAGVKTIVRGPQITLATRGACIAWRRFPSGDVVTVGHVETTSTASQRHPEPVEVTVP